MDLTTKAVTSFWSKQVMGKLMGVTLNSKKKKDSLVLFILSLLMVNSIGQLNKRAMLTGKRFWYLLVWNQLDNQIRETPWRI